MAQTGSTGVFRVGYLLKKGGVLDMTGAGAPTDGVAGTGFGKAGIGSTYTNITNGARYINTGTLASPTWTLVGTIAGDSVTTAMLQANSITPAKLDTSILQYAAVAISSADIVSASAGKLSHAQGQILVAAPAAGNAIELVSATLIYDYAGAGYGGGGNLTINWAGGGVALTGLVSAANSLGAAADKVVTFYPLSTAAVAIVSATGLNLVSSSVPWTLGSATGVARVKVVYRVHATGL